MNKIKDTNTVMLAVTSFLNLYENEPIILIGKENFTLTRYLYIKEYRRKL